MRKFYEMFSNGKLTTMWSKLSWSHYREVLSLKNVNEIIYHFQNDENLILNDEITIIEIYVPNLRKKVL